MTMAKSGLVFNNKSIIGQLIRNGNRTGSVACWKTRKSASYQAATERGDETMDTRIKSKRIEGWYKRFFAVAMTEDNYKRHTEVLSPISFGMRARTNLGASAISRKRQVLSDNPSCLSLCI